MERKRRLPCHFLIVAFISASVLCSCSRRGLTEETDVMIHFSCGDVQSKSIAPDENRISDISLMIFDDTGAAEECLWLDGGLTECSSRLLTGKKYIICACANLGRRIYADNIEELDEIRYHLAYPDDYRQGIPMYACKEFVPPAGEAYVKIELERLMAKISLRMDRRKLSKGVEMYVRSVRIGNCPRSTSISIPNKVSDKDGCFPAGYHLNASESYGLNETSESGQSKTVSVYMLENMQGSFEGILNSDNEKVFDDNDHRRAVCSYIEMELDYMSDTYSSGAYGLIYRFYLGDSRNNLDVKRNRHYHITVTPEDDGLSDDSWRVDKSDLTYTGPTYLKAYPSDYIVGDIGDRIHIWCDLLPEDAPFDVGEDYMKDDKATGIYDYVIDEDGHGATLTLTGPGRGLIYMEAGPPINDAALFIIEVNLPKNNQTY